MNVHHDNHDCESGQGRVMPKITILMQKASAQEGEGLVLISESSFNDRAVPGKELNAPKDVSGMCQNDRFNFSKIRHGTHNMPYVFNMLNVFN